MLIKACWISRPIYNNMKKIVLQIVLFLTVLTLVYALLVQSKHFSVLASTANPNSTGSPSAGQTVTTKAEQAQINNLMKRANTEITRRLTFLNTLSTDVTSLRKVSNADKTTLKNQIQQQIESLNSLASKISSDTDLTTLKSDVTSIINGYYIFAYFRVKISLMVAADRLTTTTDDMNILYAILSTRVTDLKNQGKDTVSLDKLLTDMQSNLTAAVSQYQSVVTELGGLTPQGYPGNRTSLIDVRTKIRTGAADLRLAYEDALKIRKSLDILGGSPGVKNSTDSSNLTTTVTVTPTPRVSQ